LASDTGGRAELAHQGCGRAPAGCENVDTPRLR